MDSKTPTLGVLAKHPHLTHLTFCWEGQVSPFVFLLIFFIYGYAWWSFLFIESNKPQVSFRKAEMQVKQDWILLDLDLEEGYEKVGRVITKNNENDENFQNRT